MTRRSEAQLPALTPPAEASSQRPGRASSAILTGAAVVGLLCVAIAIAAWIAGARILIFSSGSMEPTVPVGSLALTLPVATEDVVPGDIITVQRNVDERLVTHRVVAVEEIDGRYRATLRGDANEADDAGYYPLDETTQRLALSIPELGRVVAAMRSHWLIAGVFALLALLTLPTRASPNDKVTVQSPEAPIVRRRRCGAHAPRAHPRGHLREGGEDIMVARTPRPEERRGDTLT